MARPCKKRRICQLPRCTAFRPQGTSERPTVRLTLEEFECLRLMDYEGLTQAACAAQLGVARTTAQALYQSARVRLAAALVEGRPLVIEGGSWKLCSGNRKDCFLESCIRPEQASEASGQQSAQV